MPTTLIVGFAVLVGAARRHRARLAPPRQTHAVYIVTGISLLVVQVARVPLARTHTWLAMTEWLG